MIEDPRTRRAELAKMKFIASSLLLVAFIIYLVSSLFAERYVWVDFVRATAEAAMVGAIADWFAVTALFRHPLGLKIPHTAIVPTRKDHIGRSLGRFVRTNFLAQTVISDKIRSMDVAGHLAGWLAQPDNSAAIAQQVSVALGTVVQVMNDEDIQELIEAGLSERLRRARLSPILGNLLQLIASGKRQQELVSGLLKLSANLLAENKGAILEKISRETPWWLPQNVDFAIYEKIVDTVDQTLQAVDADPNHPLHEHFNQVIDHFIDDLQTSPEIMAREVAFKEELLEQAVVRDFAASLWLDIKQALVERSADPDMEVRRSIRQGLIRFGQALLSNAGLRQKVDTWIEQGILYFVNEYGYEVELLISQTIARWDPQTTSQRIELQVGKDLQFIRINGTLVGGLVGLLIHTLGFLIR